ncbi:hypothetical protein T310_1382 [Rasamsonia emersonii CBS 393.64]|uniref:Uncharacterized protein n=1 Tax=Rasamsonia emersonii (strain ATCC 16479 / CBS 393.64 / IMI 116815) TaxID=1408163 RepID=A0A0F4Z247_RASE3|nr:hypothetical protein T310_1382 [Rasamsonia emersonii CBS 393.64]KKA24594.1 hypothetical protein T310_1382 [Rasamsonia emersonii CBS 393.64]
MKFTSVAAAFALVSAAVAAPAKHPHEHPIPTPSGWPLTPTGLPTPTGGLPGHMHPHHEKVNFPPASSTILIPTGGVLSPPGSVPATDASVDELLRHKSLRSVVRRGLHLLPSEEDEALHGHHRPVPTGHFPMTGRLPVPTGL